MNPDLVVRAVLRGLPVAFLLSGAAGCGGENKLDVYREPPQVVIVAPPEGTEPYTGQPINFEAEIQVFDSTDPADVTHRWVAGDETMCETEYFSADGFGSCTYDFNQAGPVTVSVTATDPNGDRSSYQMDFVVLANTPPSIEMTGPDEGSDWAADDLIVFKATVSDTEEDAANLVVSATSNVDGPISFAAAPTSTGEWADGTQLSPGEHLLTFIVEDSYGQSDQDTLQINVFDNGPPSIDSVSTSPIPVYTDDDILAVPNGWVDFTGASPRYRYRWFIDDGGGSFAEDVAITTGTYPNGKTEKGNLLYVEVTPFNDFGDGAAIASSVAEVLNSPPEQPSVSFDPASPQPDQNLQAVILVPSYDADDDPVTYEYEWFVNGVAVAETSNVLPAGSSVNGDTVEVVVTPWDGEEYGTAATVSSAIVDVTPPDDPVIDTPEAFRNEDEWTLTGTCEPYSTVDFSCGNGITTWTFSLTCEADGTFEYADTGLTRGVESSCSAIATDSAGNSSGTSNTVTTEVCDPEDTYEDDFGTGDSGAAAIDRWTALSDDGRTTISIEGNILGASDSEDWYVISSTDDVTSDRSAGIDYYNFEVKLVDGSSDYEMYVYKGTYDPVDLECASTGGYTEYSDFVEDQLDGNHASPSDSRNCGEAGDEFLNECEDRSTDYFIQVIRTTSSTSSCQHYELEITNGVW